MAKIAIKYDNIVPYGGFFLVVPLPMSLDFFGLQYKIANSRGESAGFPRFFSSGNTKLAT